MRNAFFFSLFPLFFGLETELEGLAWWFVAFMDGTGHLLLLLRWKRELVFC